MIAIRQQWVPAVGHREQFCVEWSTEAIPERNPEYELPGDPKRTTQHEPPMTAVDAETWRWMVQRRPELACLMGEQRHASVATVDFR